MITKLLKDNNVKLDNNLLLNILAGTWGNDNNNNKFIKNLVYNIFYDVSEITNNHSKKMMLLYVSDSSSGLDIINSKETIKLNNIKMAILFGEA